ncbi:sugar transferase [Nocardioides acrostichi]|uniref:Sugar transferase n=1 Tax=Nocardioides acrostichi TaxID=2784339 RepID=A0A930V284_9ACTN|nr:sugar transferase [Nocardioides acrostichi]MBF4162541.1 sugar transferase [Nocardioides acrostichi]
MSPVLRALGSGLYGALNALAALSLVVLVSPLLAVVAIAVRLGDGGPVFFRQQRIGRYGVPFSVYKFRTMRVDAEAQLAALVAESGGSMGAFVKLKKDPRVTRVGQILRATSLDELPQLFNVVQRHMNLVGPRPQVQAEVDTYLDLHYRRLLVRPGITGLWQVSGRNDLSVEQSLHLDDHYVRRWTPMLDLVVLLRTVRVVLERRGAY